MTEFFSEPRWFRDDRGEWARVDPSVVPVESAGLEGAVLKGAVLRAAGVGFDAEFGVSGGGVRLVFEGREVVFRPRGRADVVPVLEKGSDTVVWYRDVWPSVDVRYTVGATGLKEDFVVRGPEGFASEGVFVVDVESEGALVEEPGRVGALVIDWNGDGKSSWAGDVDGPKMRIPAPIVTDASGLVAADAKPVLVLDGDVERAGVGERRSRPVGVGVDVGFVESLKAEQFPVVVDPTFEVLPASMGGGWASFNNQGGFATGMNQWGLLGDWQVLGGVDYWAFGTNLGYQYLWTNIAANPKVFSANLKLYSTPGPTAVAPAFDTLWNLFLTSVNAARVRVCHASAWSFGGMYPGWDLAKCTSGYYSGYSWADSLQGPAATTNRVDVTNLVRPWVAAKDPGGVLGVSVEQYPGTYNFKAVSPTLEVVWDQQSPAAVLTVPANDASVTSLTPTLTSGSVTDPDAGQNPPLYRAVVFARDPGSLADVDPTSSCNANSAIWSSEWLQNTTSFQVPQGILSDGVTYYWTIATMGYVLPGYPTCATPWKFTVNKRLGASGVAPVQTVGPVTVNLATGNVVAAAGSHTVATVGGSIGPSFVYNSQATAPRGLRGAYFRGVDPRSGTSVPIDFNATPFLQRIDAQIDFDWQVNGPLFASPTDRFLARWTGYVTAPTAGSYCFGTNSDDGARVWLDNVLVMDSWFPSSTGSRPCTVAPTVLAAGETKAIRVEYFEEAGGASIELRVFGGPTGDMVVPGTWLSTEPPLLGPGWTMSDGDVSVTGARSTGTGVTLTNGDGSTVQYAKSPSGAYVGPNSDAATVWVDPVSNQISVTDDAGTVYTFSSEGLLLSAVSAVDDRSPAATQMTWSGANPKLTSMTDPVSAQSVTLTYGGGSSCTIPPAGLAIASGQLCKVVSWDNRVTEIFYDSDKRLVRIVNPGGVRTDFTYDSSNRLTSVTDPSANDAVTAGVRTADASVTTQIAYTSDNKATLVTAPAPTAGATRQMTAVAYDSQPVGATLGETRVTVSGLSSPAGFTEKSKWDTQWREREIVDASGRVSQIVYDGVSDRVSYTDVNVGTAQAMRSSTAYDTAVVFNGLSRPIATYGPAPVGSFTGATPNSGAVVPSTTTAYDEGINGLSAAWWDDTPSSGEVYPYPTRPAFRGAPKVHELWAPAYSGANWVGGSPHLQIPVDNFSGRLTGLINAATAGSYQFASWGAQGTRVTVDSTMVIDGWNSNGAAPQSAPITLVAGWHRISIDIKANTGYSAFDVTWKTPGSGAFAFIPMTSLKPDLGLVTSTVSPTVNSAGVTDSVTTQNTYANPVVGQITKSVLDPTGLKLTSSATFESQGTPNQFLRQLTSTLPAGWDAAGNVVAQPGGGTQAATVTNAYYAKTEAGPTTTGCAGVSTNQAGRLKSTTKADPDGTGAVAAIVDEVAYDNTGRPVAARTVGDSAWTCTVYDARGRVTSVVTPAFTNPSDATLNTPARTVSTTYNVGSDPFVSEVSDPNSATAIRVTTDLLGRVTGYRDGSGYTTANVYDLAGRVTSSVVKNPSGVTVQTLMYGYNTAGNGLNQLNTMSLDGTQIAAVSYDTLGRQSGYTYGNGTTGANTFDSFQRQVGLSFALGGTSITSDAVTRDARTAMIVDQAVDGVDANTTGANFGYDRSGRLVNWWQRDPGSGNKYQGAYNFTGYSGTAPGCANAQWGRNSNRLSFEQKTYNTAGLLTATAVDSYCYDNADRLSTHVPVSGTSPFNGVSYDSHGNVIKMGSEVHGYDSADRHIVSKLPGGAVEYVRDATDRIVTRKLSGVISAKYAYTASADSPSLTLNSAGTVTERTISLPGGVVVTTRGTAASDVWSYPNIHGDIVATANGAGIKAGATRGYDPFGNLLGTSTTPDNSAGPFDYGWHGSAQRPLEYSSGFTPLIEMGARQYSSLLGRFLEVDPVLGGCENDYVYPSNPVGQSDIAGTFSIALGYTLGTSSLSAAAYMSKVASNFGSVFPISGAPNRLPQIGGGLDLSVGLLRFPVYVSKRSATGWTFGTGAIHPDYPGWVSFNFTRNRSGVMRLTVRAYVPDYSLAAGGSFVGGGPLGYAFRKRIYRGIANRMWRGFSANLRSQRW